MPDHGFSFTHAAARMEYGYDDDGVRVSVRRQAARTAPDHAAAHKIVRLVFDGSEPSGYTTTTEEFTDDQEFAREWYALRDRLADSRVRHSQTPWRPLTSYDEALDALTELGLDVSVDYATSPYLIVQLEHDSQIHVGAWNEPADDPRDVEGWCAEYMNLLGDPTEHHVYAERNPDPRAMARGIERFVRARQTWIAHEIVGLSDRWLSRLDVTVHERCGDHWVKIRAENGPGWVTLASHPDPHRGTSISADSLTGWQVIAHRYGQDSQIIYDVTGDSDPQDALSAIQDYLAG